MGDVDGQRERAQLAEKPSLVVATKGSEADA